jgi:hypothetical protein
MSLVVDAFEAVSGDVGVDLGGDEVGVAKEFLDAAEVGSSFQEVGGVTVAQLVGGDSGVETGQEKIRFESALEQARGDGRGRGGGGAGVACGTAGPGGVGLEDGVVGRGWVGQEVPVGADGFQGGLADGNEAFFAALASDADESFLPVDVSDLQTAQFADAQAAGVDGLQDGIVAVEGHRQRRSAPSAGRPGSGGFEGLEGGVQELDQLIHREVSGQASWQFGQVQPVDRRTGGPAAADEKPIETAQGAEPETDCRAAEVLSAQVTEEGAEIVAFEVGPMGRLLAGLLVPAVEVL